MERDQDQTVVHLIDICSTRKTMLWLATLAFARRVGVRVYSEGTTSARGRRGARTLNGEHAGIRATFLV